MSPTPCWNVTLARLEKYLQGLNLKLRKDQAALWGCITHGHGYGVKTHQPWRIHVLMNYSDRRTDWVKYFTCRKVIRYNLWRLFILVPQDWLWPLSSFSPQLDRRWRAECSAVCFKPVDSMEKMNDSLTVLFVFCVDHVQRYVSQRFDAYFYNL